MKKSVVITALILLTSYIYADEFYICIGSFINQDNAVRYMDELIAGGVPVITETANINGRDFTRVLFDTCYNDRSEALRVIDDLKRNLVLRKYGIRDLWLKTSIVADRASVLRSGTPSNSGDKNN